MVWMFELFLCWPFFIDNHLTSQYICICEIGKYKGEEYDNTKHIYHVNPQLGVQITVTVQSSFKPQLIEYTLTYRLSLVVFVINPLNSRML
jgi:hypothetical protein